MYKIAAKNQCALDTLPIKFQPIIS